MKYFPTLLLLTASLLLSQCKKDNADPLDKLPPATQTGANTFGCLVNGQAWTPQGNDGTANYTVSYDTFSDGGILQIVTYKIYGSNPTDFQTLSLWAKQINGVGTYSFLNKRAAIARYSDVKTSCFWRSADSTTVYQSGALTITRLDLTAGVISGTFAFTLYKPGCDSIRVTNGRFDKKL